MGSKVLVFFDCDGVLVDSELHGRGHDTCVASSGSHERMRLTLGTTGLRPLFEGRIYSADEVLDDMADLVPAVDHLTSAR